MRTWLRQNRAVLIFAALLFVIAFIPRLYRINNPLADWHSWRQADTAAITRNFFKDGFDPLFPRFDSFNSLNEFGLPNPKRYFLAEFPIYNLIVYPFYKIFGYDLKTFNIDQNSRLAKILWGPVFDCRGGTCYFPLDVIWSRLVSAVASSLTAVMLFLLVRRLSDRIVAGLAGLLFAVLPYNIYFGRITTSDPLHILLSVTTLYLVSIWIEHWSSKFNYLLAVTAGLAYAGALLTKPYALVLFLPIGYLLLSKVGLTKLVKYKTIYLFLFVALTPFLLWRWHISQHPEGQFGTSWLFNLGNIRGTGAYFRWLIFDRMNRLILATGGFVLFWIGMLIRREKSEGWFYHTWLAGILIFFWVIAKGNVTHDYYQMPLVPVACVLMARGLKFIFLYGEGFRQKLLNLIIIFVLVITTLAFGWYEIRGYFNINREEIVELGRYIDKNLPQDARVIAPYSFDPAFLYQTNRHGWTIGGDKIEQFIKEGATHLALVDYDEYSEKLIQKCTKIKKTKKWKLIELKSCSFNKYGPQK